MAPWLVFGGTFDPVHRGHQAIARAALAATAAERCLLIPCADPVLKAAPRAHAEQRLAMLQLAFAGDPRFAIDRREIDRGGRSYTVDTLRSLRAELGSQRPLLLLLGLDAANGLPGWQQPQALPELANLLVVERPGHHPQPAVAALGWRPLASPAALAEQPCGAMAELPTALSPASSTAVRAALAAGESCPADLDPAVATYIVEQQLYH